MKRLLKIEFTKLFYSKTFWIILGLYILLLAPIAHGFDSIFKNVHIGGDSQKVNMASMLASGFSAFDFPGVWQNMAYLASWFKLLLAVILVIHVTNEYTYKTLRQNIIDGMSKWEVVWAKELVILCISIFATVTLILLTLILGNHKSGINYLEGFQIVIAYFISIILYLNLTFFISALLKKAGFAIAILFLYSIVIEPLITFKLPVSISRFFPLELISKMIPNPMGKMLGQDTTSDFSVLNIGIGLLYITVFIYANYWMLKKGHAGKS
jgi:ABC-type transport system involved in multi-copper enzyme maturation permease subunit